MTEKKEGNAEDDDAVERDNEKKVE